VARGPCLHLRPATGRALEGGRLSVVGVRTRRAGQGRDGGGGGLQPPLPPGHLGVGPDGVAGGGGVRGALSAGGWLSGSEATAGLGGMPRLDEEAGGADGVDRDADAESAAAVAIPAGGVGRGGLVAASAVE